MSGYRTSVSAAFAFARTSSTSSVRTSMMRMFEPASASLMPCTRSWALRASSLPTNSMIGAALGNRLANELPGLAPGGQVVGADVAGARRLSGASLSCVNTSARFAAASISAVWFCGIDGRDRDAVDPLGQQVVDDALLFGGGAVRGDPELGLDIRQLLVGLLDAAPRDRPEVGGVVGDEGQP